MTNPAPPPLEACKPSAGAAESGPPRACDDSELLRRCARFKDREAFAALYLRHRRYCFQTCLRITRRQALAEESCQEALLDVWRYARSYRGGPCAKRWLYRVAARQALKALAKAKRANRAAPAGGSREGSPEDPVRRDAERHGQLRAAIDRLPGFQRQLLDCYFRMDLTQRAIGLQLRMPQSTVALRLRQTLGELAEALARGASEVGWSS